MLAPFLAFCLSARGPADVTANSLLKEMVGFDALTRTPDPYYRTAQASSYDRASVAPDKEGWFANADWGKYIGTEQRDGRTEYVMADLTGPGAVVRVWSANPSGRIRFYFDDEPKPRIECKTSDLLTGKFGLMTPPFGYAALRGTDLYFPIPYSKSLKVTVDDTDDNGASRLYYHVDYRTYPPGTEVESFDMTKVSTSLLASVANQLTHPDERPLPKQTEEQTHRFDVAPRDTWEVELQRDKPGAITEFVFAPFHPSLPAGAGWTDPRQLHNLLRNLVLSFEFDDKQTVLVPAADFFGSPPAGAAYESFPMCVRPNGEMVCRFWMPFQHTARVTVVNAGPIRAFGEVRLKVSDYKWDDHSLYFHSQWTVDRGSTRPMRDFTFLETIGSGHYVGSTLYVGNPVPGWWGEGDEKVWIDEDTFPSMIGTGTEDYFGYAWSDPRPYDHIPYHTQPNAGAPGNFGHISNNRWHFFDPINFTERFHFTLEIWHWIECEATFAGTSYWYATFDSEGPVAPDASLFDVQELKAPGPVEGAIEGEKLKVLERAGGTTQVQDGFWEDSGGAQLWWIDCAPGSRLVLELNVPEDGTYTLTGSFCHAADYGIHEITVDGTSAGQHDFYGTGVNWKKIALGTFSLKKGPVKVEVRSVGSNPKADPKRNMFGLDYFLLEKV